MDILEVIESDVSYPKCGAAKEWRKQVISSKKSSFLQELLKYKK